MERTASSPATIFLAGPPGSGKTTLGKRACAELSWRFLDLHGIVQSVDDATSALARIVAAGEADLIELPWELTEHRAALSFARRSGILLGLWAHPLEMQARSGHTGPLFTRVGRLKTHGGFGRRGTGCVEFRRLQRACEEVLVLVGDSVDSALPLVKEVLAEHRAPAGDADPAERAGISDWSEILREDCGATLKAARIVVNAMARYILHLKADGTSPRTLTGICSDLQAASMLVFMYDAPNAGRALDRFSGVPFTLEYERKFTDSPNLVARYERSLQGFARFLSAQAPLSASPTANF